MATIKVASLLLKTLAKPMATKLKQQAKEHETFRTSTISIAQFMHRAEMNVMRVKLLGETHHPKTIRPLNDAKAIDAGANFISEAFLFAFATALILAENWRSRRKEGARRDMVAERLEGHDQEIKGLRELLDEEMQERGKGLSREKELEKVVEEIVGIGLRGGWLEAPSAVSGWKKHAELAQETRETGRLPDRIGQESAVLRELDSVAPLIEGDEASRSNRPTKEDL